MLEDFSLRYKNEVQGDFSESELRIDAEQKTATTNYVVRKTGLQTPISFNNDPYEYDKMFTVEAAFEEANSDI